MPGELDLIAMRWLLRDIRADRLSWSPLKDFDLRELIDRGFVEVIEGAPIVTGAGYEILGEADLSSFRPAKPDRPFASPELPEHATVAIGEQDMFKSLDPDHSLRTSFSSEELPTAPQSFQSQEEVEAAMKALMNRRPTVERL